MLRKSLIPAIAAVMFGVSTIAAPAPALAEGLFDSVSISVTPKGKSAVAMRQALAAHSRVNGLNRATIQQKGSGNAAGIGQHGTGNVAGIYQNGRKNIATGSQTGNNNALAIVQLGNNKTANVKQTGNNKTQIVFQAGF